MTNTIDRFTLEEALAQDGVSFSSIYTSVDEAGCVAVDLPAGDGLTVVLALTRYAAGLREECSYVAYEVGSPAAADMRETAERFDQLAGAVRTESTGVGSTVSFPGWSFED